MPIIRLIDKQGELVVEENVPPNQTSLAPLPRVIHREDKSFRFEYYFGNNKIAVYKETNSV